jgi:hypothetical protein
MNVLRYFSLMLLMSLVAIACETPAESNNEEQVLEAKKSAVEQKWDEMMVVHDEVMPETSKLVRQQKALTEVPNSETTVEALAEAEDAMWDWMNNLKQKAEVMEMEEAEAIAYLEQEMVTIKKVQQKMTSSLAAANDLLEEEN